jgi:hypothetical protein
MRLTDWMMDLPRESALEFSEKIHLFEEERKMRYITSIERLALEKGREEARQEAFRQGLAIGLRQSIAAVLEVRFGAMGLQLEPAIDAVCDVETLGNLLQALRFGATLDDFRKLLPEHANKDEPPLVVPIHGP